MAAVVSGGYLYALGGQDVTPNYWNSVERAVIYADGSLGTWQSTSSMTTQRVGLAAVASGGNIYAFGGCNETMNPNRVEHAAINADGSLGTWQIGGAIYTSDAFAGAGSLGYLYSLGGTAGPASVGLATINPDGSVTGQPTTSMSTPRISLAAATWNGKIYALGGYTTSSPSPWLSSVERARINAISLYALSPSPVRAGEVITISGANILPIAALRLGESTNLATTYISSSTLTATVPASMTDGMYSATLTNGDGQTAFLSNALLVDSDPPVGSIIIDGGATYAYTRTVTLTLSASDLSGVAAMAFSDDGVSFTAFEPYATSKAWTLTEGDGTKTVFAGFQDRAGNVSPAVSDTIILKAAPTGTVIINKGATTGQGAVYTTSPNVILALSATATNPSGIARFRTSTDGINYSNWFNYVTAPSANLGSGDGPKTIYVQFKDGLGNVSTAYTDTIILDTSKGTDYGLSINNGATFTNKTAVALTLPAQAGTAEMQVSNDGGFAGAQWEPYSLFKDWQIISYGKHEIPRTVYARFRNTVGGTSGGFSDDIILDVTPPKGSVSIVGSSGSAARRTNSAVTLALSATDDVSGVGSMMLSNRADFAVASWEPYATSRGWTLDSNQTVYVRYRDNAGNVSQTYSASLPGGVWTIFFPFIAK